MVGVLGAGIAGLVAGLIVGIPSLRARGHYYLIVTFAAAEAVRVLADNTWPILNGPEGLTLVQSPSLFGLTVTSLQGLLYLNGALLILIMLALSVLRGSRRGRVMYAIRENEALARSLGIEIWPTKLLAFAIGGGMAGVVGAVYVPNLLHIEPDLFGGWAGVQIALILLIGGTRHTLGPFVGALLVVMAPSAVGLGPAATQITYGVALIVLILFMPKGIVGTAASMLTSLARRSGAGDSVG